MTYAQLIGILGVVAIALCWSLAIVLFRVGTAGSVARKLAVLAAIEGVVLASAGFPEYASGLDLVFWESFYESRPTLFFLSGLVHHGGDGLMVALYPPFLALALNTSLTRPFVNPRVLLGLGVGTAAIVLLVAINPSGPNRMLLYTTVTLLFVYALVSSIHAWRTAERGLARERAALFSLAFGLRDLGWCLSYAIAAWYTWTQPDEWGMTALAWAGKLVYALGTLFSVPIIAYGILRSKLFDIDLKIRWTIKQSTFATIVVTFVFLVTEGADRLLSAEFGNVAGLLAAALVVFFIAPLQRFAEGVATRAMPNTKNTPEYAAFRKMQVYEEAVYEAHIEGGISEKERALLGRLRASLGISEADAVTIEQEITANQATLS